MKSKILSTKNQHVIPLGKGWAVKAESSNDLFIITEKQSEAIKVARQLAQNSKVELIIHGKNGQIREREQYGTMR